MADKINPIGGQAVIEGVMMRGKHQMATAVRTSSGEIVIKKSSLESSSWRKNPFFKLPFIRGVVALVDSMVIGIKELNYSANMALPEDEKKTASEKSKFLTQSALILSLVLGLGFAILLFKVIPAFFFVKMEAYTQNTLLLNLLEGLIKIGIFLGYLYLIAQMKDVKRLFQYHGAEHKTVSAHEAGELLTVENVKKYSTIHPRCGTSFMLITFVVGIVVFSFLGNSHDMWSRVLGKLALFPVVAGVSYEIIRLAGTSRYGWINRLAYYFTTPGMWFQKITTAEPNHDQMEVAIAALEGALVREEEVIGSEPVLIR